MNGLSLNIVRQTRNYEALLRFYGEMLGMEEVDSWNEPASRGTLFSPGEKIGVLIEVLEPVSDSVPDVRVVNAALNIEVENINSWFDQLAAAGVTIGRGLKDMPWGDRSFGVDDPDGFRLWFYEKIGSK